VPAWPPASPAAARGPGRTRRGLFFNPASAFARDLSVLYLAAVVRPGLRVLDGLTGVGARAARWRREVPGDYQITANDRSPDAVAVAGRNLAPDRERGAGVRLLQRPLGDLLAAERFDLIEIDAPGTPAPFLDAACRAVRAGPPGGHLLVTATDAIALAGAQPDVCHRRYGARPLRGELGHEVAVRILLGAVVRAAARCGLAAAPVLAYRHDHLYGAFVRLVEDDQAASLARDALGYAALCPWCWDRRVVPGGVPPAACAACGRPVRVGGPLWTGGLGDAAVLRRLLALADSRPLAAGDAVRAALAGWLDEAGAPPLFYDLHAAAARCGAVAMPPLETIRQRLESLGHVAVRTHFGRTGVKTDAGPGLILELIAARQRSAVLPGASAPPAPGPRTAPPPRFAGG
jgi:tRNA (guanine26-N2/guanine27-N2)-dimethyltransferase